MKRALVTGASGFLGRALVAVLRAQGSIVGEVVSDRSGLQVEPPQFCLRHGEIADFEEILEAFSPDVVFHLAGRTANVSLAELYGSNVLLAANLLEAIRRHGRHPMVVLAGSAAEYGPVAPDAVPVTEDQPCLPINDYGISKLAQTLTGLARARAGLPVTVARIFNPIGPGMPQHLALGSFAAQLRTSAGECDLSVGNLDVERDFIDADEAARLISGLGFNQATRGSVYNVCSGQAFSLRFLVEELIRVSGRSVRIVTDPARFRLSDMPRFVGSTARLEALGLHPGAPDFDVLLPKLLSDSATMSLPSGVADRTVDGSA